MDKIIAAAEVAVQEEKTDAPATQNTAPTAELATQEEKASTLSNEKKVSLISIGVPPTFGTKEVQIGDATVKVYSRIPYETFFEMIEWAIDLILQEKRFISAPLKSIVSDFAILKYFTNFDIDTPLATKTVKEIYETYDLIDSYGIIKTVIQSIDSAQIEFFNYCLDETLKSIAAFKNSAYGVVEEISKNAEDLTKSMEKSLDMVQGNSEESKKITKILKAAETLR